MMVFFRKEIESKNLIDWNWFPKKEYKVITKFLNYRHLATLTFDELIQLIDDLKFIGPLSQMIILMVEKKFIVGGIQKLCLESVFFG